MITQRADLTYKGNFKQGRHSWLRLTPAYSVKVVQHILDSLPQPGSVLDPFSGTGTTGLTCAERGLACDLIEINPFLAWFARAKTRSYTAAELAAALELARSAVARVNNAPTDDLPWVPPIHHIERWWTTARLSTLSRLFAELQHLPRGDDNPVADLVLIAFCRLVIDWSNAAFNHQSMSFKTEQPTLFVTHEQDLMLEAFLADTRQIIESARQPLSGKVSVHHGNSRQVDASVTGPFQYVITSPPYPNRMSYIRELRPYMYWLGYLNEAREAGDLDWAAIGGTWGIATSRLMQWTPNGTPIKYPGFDDLVQHIGEQSPLLANYVHRYFVDTAAHLTGLSRVL
ncbi:MAG: SAM-dependent methyltransferase, partial [Chloroflexi bacterium]|nr:SAM-dependent methyltransferase [Chloroflexota bacterium]